jgi:hypothetical protein
MARAETKNATRRVSAICNEVVRGQATVASSRRSLFEELEQPRPLLIRSPSHAGRPAETLVNRASASGRGSRQLLSPILPAYFLPSKGWEGGSFLLGLSRHWTRGFHELGNWAGWRVLGQGWTRIRFRPHQNGAELGTGRDVRAAVYLVASAVELRSR